MARSYGQIVAAIWRDPDFRKLPLNAQWAYIMLATQGDISSCGLLSITLGRWAGYASDLDRDGLSDALSVLSDAHFVVVDWDTEELLVRSFAKWDGGSTNSKRRPAILAAANAIVSPVLRGVVAVELTKLGVRHDLSDTPSDALPHDPSDSPWDTPSDSDPIGQGSGYVSGVRATTQNRNHNQNPEPGIQDREPRPIPDADNAAPPITCSNHPNGTEQPCGPCGTARKRHAQWLETQTRDTTRRREATAAQIRNCPHCDEHGMVLDSRTLKPIGRCDHGATS